MTEDVVSMLQHFGLSDKEAEIYLSCLELGSSSIQKLSKYSRLNRSTVHFVAESLKKKGLFGETRKGKKRLLFAESPRRFEKLLLREKANFKLKETALIDLMPMLEDVEQVEDSRAQVRFYEGMDGFFKICKRSIQKAQDEILFLSSYSDFLSVGGQRKFDETYYIPTRIKKKIPIRMLLFKGPRSSELKGRQEKELRQVKFLPSDFKFTSTIFVYGDEFSMVSSKPPFLGVVIKSKELAHTVHQIYELLWMTSKK